MPTRIRIVAPAPAATPKAIFEAELMPGFLVRTDFTSAKAMASSITFPPWACCTRKESAETSPILPSTFLLSLSFTSITAPAGIRTTLSLMEEDGS